jgi:hypothetical protein
MTDDRQHRDDKSSIANVNPHYATFQIAKALETSEEHPDAEARKRAQVRIAKWEAILGNMLSGSVEYGSRAPFRKVPVWATLEVITGGFATGNLLASGPLLGHETSLLAELAPNESSADRRALNSCFLKGAGLAQLRVLLRTCCYDVDVPEEGALLVLAWLVENGHAEDAQRLLNEITAFFPSLRFYPVPLEKPRRVGTRVHRQDVGTTIQSLQRIRPNTQILAQKEAVEIWAPFYDRVVTLFLETMENDLVCQRYPAHWSEHVQALLDEYDSLRKTHTLCNKLERSNGHSAQLKAYLGSCAKNPAALTASDTARIQFIVTQYLKKRGAPGSATATAKRQRQIQDVRAPTYHAITQALIARLESQPADDGLDNVNWLMDAVNAAEAEVTGVPHGTEIPSVIQRKVERCINETIEVLIERKLITSGEALANVLPQMTSGLRSAGITDPSLRYLYSAIYRAFRRRRSLLLLNFEKQVQFEELPWVAIIEKFRRDDLSNRELAKQALEEITVATLTAFPHAIIPNKLLQELQALVTGAGLDIPLVSELAADIFMGDFSAKFVESARVAADMLESSLYAKYYGIDYAEIRQIPNPQELVKRTWFWQQPAKSISTVRSFADICAQRTGVTSDKRSVAVNGMLIEQQQIITTQNLATLFSGLGLHQLLRAQLCDMAKACFSWICRHQQLKMADGHACLIMLKNTAYAWRQMIFYLAMLPTGEVADFLRWADNHLKKQPTEFHDRFLPALRGLMLAADGRSLESDDAKSMSACRFTGGANARHWLWSDVR